MKPFDVEALRTELLHIRSRCDSALASLSSPAPANDANPVAAYMTSTEFADFRRCSVKTVSRFCAAGMPHSGGGHARRIPTKEAVTWIDNGGPQFAARQKGMTAQ